MVDDLLVDRAFVAERQTAALPLIGVAELPSQAPHVVADALAAAALTRSQGISAGAVRSGLAAFSIDRHRIEEVGTVAGVGYVNDSKATNPHAAEASLLAYPSVVWIAGGKAKGLEFDDLVQKVADRLRAVVLLGTDRAVVAGALSRHAPQVPVVDVTGSDTRAMADVVAAASRYAQPGDTVLLAPGCASTDMFAGFGARGDAFVEQVRALPGWQPPGGRQDQCDQR
jgi:UDP-N-acetylmuramoylalanine--D-glutamate ligase